MLFIGAALVYLPGTCFFTALVVHKIQGNLLYLDPTYACRFETCKNRVSFRSYPKKCVRAVPYRLNLASIIYSSRSCR